MNDDVPHGTNNGYVNHRCRCVGCTTAHSAYIKEYRQRTNHYHARLKTAAERIALRVLKEHTPDVYDEVMREARELVGSLPARQQKVRVNASWDTK